MWTWPPRFQPKPHSEPATCRVRSASSAPLNPGASYTQIINLITRNVEPEAGLAGKTITGGEINAYNSLLAGDPAPAASASPSTVTTTWTDLSESDSYGSTGDSGLTYTWSVSNKPTGVATPTFRSDNGTNAAKSLTATFYAAGNYTFEVTISDGEGFSTTASVPVTVDQTPTSIAINPASATVSDSGQQSFTATVDDQFDNAIFPPTLTWSVNSGGVGGTISSGGTYTAPTSGAGTDTVKATSGTASATATVTVTSPSGGSISIDCGSSTAVGSYAADSGYVVYSSGGPFSTSNGVNTTLVADPAPQAVYDTGQYGNFTDTFHNLTPNGSYSVLLQFVEFAHNQPGQREFDVYVNNSSQPSLTDYDIYAEAGAENTAVTALISTAADSNGNLALRFATVIDGAYCSAITVTPVISIDCGSSTTVGSYVADTGYVHYTSGNAYSTTAGVDTSLVADPAPQAVYDTGQYGTFTDTITGLTPNLSYSVLLQFVEFAHNQPHEREFDVYVNNSTQPSLTDYDIYAEAGAMDKAVTATIPAT